MNFFKSNILSACSDENLKDSNNNTGCKEVSTHRTNKLSPPDHPKQLLASAKADTNHQGPLKNEAMYNENILPNVQLKLNHSQEIEHPDGKVYILFVLYTIFDDYPYIPFLHEL